MFQCHAGAGAGAAHVALAHEGHEPQLRGVALALYVIHYLLQMIFGFRASGEDAGALVNMVFYLPVAFLLTCATLRISAGQKYLRRFVRVGATGTAVVLALFAVGLSNIRIEEDKRMLSERDYSIESIAESCGFSSVSWMREKFKASTGMTPAEWREAQGRI